MSCITPTQTNCKRPPNRLRLCFRFCKGINRSTCWLTRRRGKQLSECRLCFCCFFYVWMRKRDCNLEWFQLWPQEKIQRKTGGNTSLGADFQWKQALNNNSDWRRCWTHHGHPVAMAPQTVDCFPCSGRALEVTTQTWFDLIQALCGFSRWSKAPSSGCSPCVDSPTDTYSKVLM